MADTIWATDLWPAGFWADGLWTNEGAPDPPDPTPVVETFSGGFFFGFDHHLARRRRREREEEEARTEAQAIQDQLDREIALLLRQQEAKDEQRRELERLQALADQYAGTKQPVPRRVSTALLKAYEERSRNALEQLQREVERMLEEEELALMIILNQ